MRRGVGVVFCVRRLVEHRHVVIQGHEDILGHDRVQQGVQIDEEGDHLPGEVAAHLEHVTPDHPGVVDLRRVILACQIIKQLITKLLPFLLLLTYVSPGYPVELPDEPDTDGDVEQDQDPVAGHEQQREDQQLQPELGNIPEIQTATTFLGVQIVTLKVREGDDEEHEDEDQGAGDEQEDGEQPDVAQHWNGDNISTILSEMSSGNDNIYYK